MRQIQVALCGIGLRLFRNNTGMGWVGKLFRPTRVMTIAVGPGDVLLREAFPLHAGLCEGSSDLIGWVSVTVTKEMVGKNLPYSVRLR
jgi:hypothetical protein